MGKTLEAHVDAIISIAGITLDMTQIDGFDIVGEVSANRDPGARFPRKTPAPPDIEDGTTTVQWDQAIHGPVIGRLRALVSSGTPASVGKIIRDGNGNRIGLTTYSCQLMRLGEPKGNTMGGTAQGNLVLGWSADGLA